MVLYNKYIDWESVNNCGLMVFIKNHIIRGVAIVQGIGFIKIRMGADCR